MTGRPSSRQRAVIRRHFVQVLSSKVFRRALKAWRRRWGMTRQQLGTRAVWAIPQSRIAKSRTALRRFGQFWFRGLGRQWAANRFVFDAIWETRPLTEVVEEMASVMERLAASEDGWRADQEIWRQKKWPGVHSTHTGYYAGEEPFQPTVIWDEKRLREDLKSTAKGHAVPSNAHAPWLKPTRSFIEHYPWTEEEDMLRAFRLTRRFQLKILPRKAQLNRDPAEGFRLYERYCAGDDLKELVRAFTPRSKGDGRRDLRRSLSQVASLFSLSNPIALRKTALAQIRDGGRSNPTLEGAQLANARVGSARRSVSEPSGIPASGNAETHGGRTLG